MELNELLLRLMRKPQSKQFKALFPSRQLTDEILF